MSRHRNFRKMNYDDERDDDDGEEFHRYSLSMDDDVPMSPNTAKFMYHRPKAQAGNTSRLSDFVMEEQLENDVVYDEHDSQFELEVDRLVPETKKSLPAQPSSSVTFITSRQRDRKAPAGANAKVSTEEKRDQTPKRAAKEEQPRLLIPEVENLRLSEVSEKARGDSSVRPPTLTPNASSKRLSALAVAQATPTASPKVRHRTVDEKPLINLVIVGHVDAGKSTLMGHLLYQLGRVDERTMHKYKQESARTGKASFAFAWVLDDTQEERQRGVTMDIAKTTFETEHRRIVLLDAPGHKDFIPNMITGASQADAGLLVVNATTGEFETGFDLGGQTREHAMLLRSLGVTELSVAVNKLDTVDWSQARYDEVCGVLRNFLRKQAAFPVVHFIPVSGLNGINLIVPPPDDHPLRGWYNGPTLLQFIDGVSAPTRGEDRPLRAVINDVLKTTPNSVTVSVKVEAGHTECGEKVFIMPNADAATVKGVSMEDTNTSGTAICFAGDHAILTLSATTNFEPDSINSGQVLCRGGKECLIPAKRFVVRLVVFNIVVPIMKGTKAELFAHSLCEPCTVVRLRSALSKASGEVLKQKPRCLTRNMSGMVEIQTDRAISVESYAECKALGRITLRSGGQTIAAGIIEQVLE
uniref:Tr-type G domain-containing protein n=2 Tax=Ascaris TaxID=6251 RepID=A0A0M3HTA9_ASCLU